MKSRISIVNRIPPSAENDVQPRQPSVTHLSFADLTVAELDSNALPLKPRRRLLDSATDRADGLDILIQKTKAIGLRHGEEGLVIFS
jgi:hypothetical protein